MTFEYRYYPSPMLSIKYALEQYGGWSRLFAISSDEYDKRYIHIRENEPGFWAEFAKVKMDEQFREEVETATEDFIEEYGRTRPKSELRTLISKALLDEGWKPNKSKVLREIRFLKKEKRESIEALKSYRRD